MAVINVTPLTDITALIASDSVNEGDVLSAVGGVVIEGINMRHYRASGILIQAGSGNRIVNNTINNMMDAGIEIVGSGGNLIWKNEICNCFEGIR